MRSTTCCADGVLAATHSRSSSTASYNTAISCNVVTSAALQGSQACCCIPVNNISLPCTKQCNVNRKLQHAHAVILWMHGTCSPKFLAKMLSSDAFSTLFGSCSEWKVGSGPGSGGPPQQQSQLSNQPGCWTFWHPVATKKPLSAFLKSKKRSLPCCCRLMRLYVDTGAFPLSSCRSVAC